MLRLQCATQNYAWGKLGSSSIVGRIAQSNQQASSSEEELKAAPISEEMPFAEYWMGDHVNGPSKFVVSNDAELSWINEPAFVQANLGLQVSLSQLLQLNPEKYLGVNYAAKYPYAGQNLAFLFKVLSVRTALSIQAHPDRPTAERLHAAQPSIYKDPNPKPEVAVALTEDFAACFGFATPATLNANFAASPTLQSIVSECTGGKYSQCEPENAEWLRDMIAGLFNHLDTSPERLAQVIAGLKSESE